MFKLGNIGAFLMIVRLCCGVKCVNNTCLDIPLKDHLEAPLTAKLDISDLNKQIISLVRNEVEDAVLKLFENITNDRFIKAEERLVTEVKNSMDQNVRGLNGTFDQLSTRLNDIFEWHSSRLDDKLEQHSTRLEDAFEKLSAELENNMANLNRSLRQELLQQSGKTALTIKEHVKVDNNLNSSIQQLESQLVTKMAQQESRMNTRISGFQAKISKVDNSLKSSIQQLESQSVTKINQQETRIISKLAEANTKVSLTACLYDDEYANTRSPGYIIKFSDMRSKVGINDISSFTKDGKFTCEKDGLYLITVTFLTITRHGRVGIYKNGSLLTATYTTSENNGEAYSSTAVAAVELQQGDKIWIQVEKRSTYIYAANWQESCITIVKVM